MGKIQIKQEGSKTYIILDGKDISNMVRAFSFEKDASKKGLPVLKLDVISTDVSVDGACIPELPEIFKDFYKPIK